MIVYSSLLDLKYVILDCITYLRFAFFGWCIWGQQLVNLSNIQKTPTQFKCTLSYVGSNTVQCFCVVNGKCSIYLNPMNML
jgi:hypothetical protein